MKADLFARALPEPVIARLHALRRLGNDAAHGGEPSTEQVRLAVRQAHDVSRLLLVLVDQLPPYALPIYDPRWPRRPRRPARPHQYRRDEPEPIPAAETVARAARAVELNESGTRTELIDGLLLESGWRGNAVAERCRWAPSVLIMCCGMKTLDPLPLSRPSALHGIRSPVQNRRVATPMHWKQLTGSGR